jgi:hypothetical protein
VILVRLCKRVDPPASDIHIFLDRLTMSREMDKQGGVWICKVYYFYGTSRLEEFLNYMYSKYNAIIHLKR